MDSPKGPKAPPEWDAILTASMKNDAAAIRLLVEEKGVSPSHANSVAQSALHIASLWGNVDAVRELLKQKAAVNVLNQLSGATPLHCATMSIKGNREGRFQCMELLIANGASTSLPDFNGRIPADYCVNDPEMARLLRPNHPPLFLAIENGKVEEVQKLVKGIGKDQNEPIYEERYMGHTPFQYALNLLLAEQEDTASEANAFDRTKLAGTMRVLLEAGANPNAVAGNMRDPIQAMEHPVLPPLYRVCRALQTAYKNGDDDDATPVLEETCRLLLEHHAPVTPEMEELLHNACRKNELRLAKLLLEVVQMDPNTRGRQGMTALQFAARSGKLEMVQYLLSRPNIDVSVPDDRGMTALDSAKHNNKQNVVALLEEHATAMQL